MGLSITYRLIDKDLVINEELNWAWNRKKTDQVRVWTLKNVDTTDLDRKLKILTEFQDEADFELSSDKKELRIYLDYHDEELIIKSDEANFSFRDYDKGELKDIIDKLHEHLENEDKRARLSESKISSLEKLINDELDRKTKILEGTKEETPAYIKALTSFDILTKIKRNLLSEE